MKKISVDISVTVHGFDLQEFGLGDSTIDESIGMPGVHRDAAVIRLLFGAIAPKPTFPKPIFATIQQAYAMVTLDNSLDAP